MNPIVRLRAAVERFRTSLFALPVLIIAGLVTTAVATLWIDNRSGTVVPEALRTTVPSARTILGTIATGLVAGAALLFSSVLVAVQLAASQYSPRTTRNYLRDRGQQAVIGVVVGTAVFCLVVLVRTRAALDDNGAALVPHLSVLVAVTLGSLAVLGVVAGVNRLARSLQVEHQLESVMKETISIVRERPRRGVAGAPPTIPPPTSSGTDITAPVTGWVQQISIPALCDATRPGDVTEVATHAGDYVWEGTVIARVWTDLDVAGDHASRVRGAFAFGPERTMQEDVGFGIVRLVDVALRALSPGVNDPNTAIDVIGRIGAVLLACGEHADERRIHVSGGATVVMTRARTFADHVRSAVTPLRPVAVADVGVACTLAGTLRDLASELDRRGSGVDTRALTTELGAFIGDVTAGPLSEADTRRVLAVAGVATAAHDD